MNRETGSESTTTGSPHVLAHGGAEKAALGEAPTKGLPGPAPERRRLGLILAGLLLAIFVSAIDNTVVSTAMGTIVASLGGFNDFVWVTAAYMATETAGMPVIGKLSDMYGRKRFFLFGLALFIFASMLCGTAHTMWQLALYRALQGVGGGALAPVAFTIIFDVVPPDRAGRFSGMFGAVFGAASIIGPLLGAYITEHLSWRWVFFINLPLGVIALLLVGLAYRESRRHVRQAVDWAGTMTLVPAAGCLMFGLQLGGQRFAWSSPVIVTLLCLAALLFALFLWVEARAEAPIVSYAMFRERLFSVANLVGLFSSAAFVVAVVYIPIYVQGVRGGDASSAGLTLLPMMLGSSVSAPVGGQLCQRAGYRRILLASGAVFTAALLMLIRLTPTTPRWWLIVAMALLGLGIGPTFSMLSMAVMQPFGFAHRGAASATMSFVRELGMTVSITVYGVLERNRFAAGLQSLWAPSRAGGAHGLAGAPAGAPAPGAAGAVPPVLPSIPDPRMLLSPELRAHIPAAVLDRLTGLLTSSITATFTWTLVPALLALVLSLGFGRARWTGFGPAPAPDGETGRATANPPSRALLDGARMAGRWQTRRRRLRHPTGPRMRRTRRERYATSQPLQPTAADEPPALPRPNGRGDRCPPLARAALAQRPPQVLLAAPNIAELLGVGGGEVVLAAAVVLDDIVKIRGVGGVDRRLDRRHPRVGDGTGRQTRVEVGVVRVVDGEIAVGQAVAVADDVLHGGVNLQLHPPLQAVVDDAGNHRPLLVHLRLPLNQRRFGDGLGQRQPLPPHRSHHRRVHAAGEVLQHRVNHVMRLLPADKVVRVGEQVPFQSVLHLRVVRDLPQKRLIEAIPLLRSQKRRTRTHSGFRQCVGDLHDGVPFRDGYADSVVGHQAALQLGGNL